VADVIVAMMIAGGIAVIVAWRVVASGRASIWPVLGATLGLLGVLSVATGRVPLSPRVGVETAVVAGLGAGVMLYLATAAFVLVVRRWPVFDRHVEAIYDQRKGLPLWLALLLAAGVAAPGEELFWRGLVQPRLAGAAGWIGGTAAAWGAYVVANLASENLPIVAGGIVGGASWAVLALWTHGVLASVLAHAAWTALMLGVPPGGSKRREHGPAGSAASSLRAAR
jgi:uncharacterized protein